MGLELVQKLLPEFRPRLDRIVPVGARFVSMEAELLHFLVGHFDLFVINVSVVSRRHTQAAFVGRTSNGIEHQAKTTQRQPGPVIGDRAEQAMFYVVPLRRAAWIVSHGDRKALFVGPTLQFTFPKSGSMAIAAAAVRGDQEFLGVGVLFRSCLLPPIANRMNGKLGCIGRCADRDVPSLVMNVVNAVGNCAAFRVAGKVVHRDLVRLLAPKGAGVLEVPDQFRVFRVHANHRLTRFEELSFLSLDVAKLEISVWMWRSREAFDVCPQREAHRLQQPPYGHGRHRIQLTRRPPQRATHIFSPTDRVAFEPEPGKLQLIDGHGRTEIVGDQEVPTVILDVTAEEAKMLIAVTGQTALLADWDQGKIFDIVSAYQATDADLAHFLAGIGQADLSGADDLPAPDGGPDEMDLRPHEHYDYVIVLARTTQEWGQLCDLLSLTPIAVGRGNQRNIGLGRAVTASKLITLLERHGNSSDSDPES